MPIVATFIDLPWLSDHGEREHKSNVRGKSAVAATVRLGAGDLSSGQILKRNSLTTVHGTPPSVSSLQSSTGPGYRFCSAPMVVNNRKLLSLSMHKTTFLLLWPLFVIRLQKKEGIYRSQFRQGNGCSLIE